MDAIKINRWLKTKLTACGCLSLIYYYASIKVKQPETKWSIEAGEWNCKLYMAIAGNLWDFSQLMNNTIWKFCLEYKN